MNIQVKAAGIVAGIMTAGVAGALIAKLVFTYISTETLGKIGVVIILAALLHLFYTIVLTQLKSKEKIQQMVDRK